MKHFYNKKTFIEALRKRGIARSKDSLYADQNRRILKPAGMLDDGKREVPIYDDESVKGYVETIERLKKDKKVRFKIYK